eukprot:7862847-Alexandrium_andersonii.AAC.1
MVGQAVVTSIVRVRVALRNNYDYDDLIRAMKERGEGREVLLLNVSTNWGGGARGHPETPRRPSSQRPRSRVLLRGRAARRGPSRLE